MFELQEHSLYIWIAKLSFIQVFVACRQQESLCLMAEIVYCILLEEVLQ